MDFKRRDFIKGCTAGSALLLSGISYAAISESPNKAPSSDASSHIEKSIKASFGGGFSVQTHSQSNGLTHANIQHFGKRYAVTSADLLDWKIVGTL